MTKKIRTLCEIANECDQEKKENRCMHEKFTHFVLDAKILERQSH